VRDAKRRHAATTQAGLKNLLDKNHAEYTSYWIDNSLYVTGDSELLTKIAKRPEVDRVEADEAIMLPEPLKTDREAAVNGVEWNIDRVNAPRVWNELGVRGEGIVVANIDSGVKFDHPAVANQYRGKASDGTVDHNYNWFDPAQVCSGNAPCDNNDHGTHTMGTMVGDDGAGNQIGVAPGAKWIAAKGCETNSCSRTSLLASGQWIVAPTDLSGQNPRPDLAPDVVNNSWGSSVYDAWYTETVQSWIAAGIFPAFSNGNSGPSCNSSGTPGEYQISYSSGAFDINNAIASFSSRGPGENGEIKPNIAAPGVAVRSSIPSGYDSFSGTSMASPHTAATVALMWSASPAIQGDITATEELLDNTASDVDDTTCGGTAADNHVWGEGKLDAYAAVAATPRGALGAAAGTVTSGGQPLAGATVVFNGPMSRTITTDSDGTYAFDRLMVGDYTVTVRKFGYLTGSGSASVAEGQTTTADFAMDSAPSSSLSGSVLLSTGAAAAGATIDVLNTPLSTQTDAQGNYQLTIPHGDYEVRVTHSNQCAGASTTSVSVTSDTTHDVTLPERVDAFGYSCGGAVGDYVPGVEPLALTGDDEVANITLPFKAPLYGEGYRNATVSTNGWISFIQTTSSAAFNREIPDTGTPNAVLYPFWDDLFMDAESGVYTRVIGEKPNRQFLVEWRNITFYSDRNTRLSFTATISEAGVVTYRYSGIDTARDAGESATVGIEDAAGVVAFQYSFDDAAMHNGGIALRASAGVANGAVLDANDDKPVPGAVVTIRSGGDVVDSAVTDADGEYLLHLKAGDYQATVEKQHYEKTESDLAVSASEIVEATTKLRTARVQASTENLAVVTPAGETRGRVITLTNTGGLGTGFTVGEATDSGAVADVPWLSVDTETGDLSAGGKQEVTVSVDAAGMTDSSYQKARLEIRSASGRAPTLTIPITIVAPGYVAALDSGAEGDAVDSYGDTWTADQKHTEGSCGYLGSSTSYRTSNEISGTDDDARYQDQREGMYEYRFDGLADGVYTVELNFAELRNRAPDSHLFDVHIEGVEKLRMLDVAYQTGSYAALDRTFTVQVSDGTLNVRFFTHKGYGKPMVNAIRVVDRPDLAA
ncbi:MAG: carboxypeptidase regulatory-like domain-containing protein, partial [Micromonosporaceae bacterium]